MRLHELTVVRASLEAAFMELTADSVEYRAGQGPGGEPAAIGQSATDTGTPTGTEDRHSVEGRI